jgi:hypothetical protein
MTVACRVETHRNNSHQNQASDPARRTGLISGDTAGRMEQGLGLTSSERGWLDLYHELGVAGYETCKMWDA